MLPRKRLEDGVETSRVGRTILHSTNPAGSAKHLEKLVRSVVVQVSGLSVSSRGL